MTTEQSEGAEDGVQLLHAVERILAPPSEILEIARSEHQAHLADLPGRPARARQQAAAALVVRYAARTAMAGGVSSLPALIPGVGTAAALLGGGLADMAACLKYETEMVMALSACYGHDITDAQERRRCLLLAGHLTYADKAGQSATRDYLIVGKAAFWDYSARQLGKALATLFMQLAVVALSKGLFKAIPIAGAVVSYAANKALTKSVGAGAIAALEDRDAGDRGRVRNPFA